MNVLMDKDPSATSPATPAAPVAGKSCATAYGYPRNFLGHRFVYLVVSPRARGLSIGINFNPDKRCNFDCVYCEVDRSVPGRDRELDVDVMADELTATIEASITGTLRDMPIYQNLPDPRVARTREHRLIDLLVIAVCTNLARGHETDVANRCQTILNLGTENSEVLAAKYNVSAADLKAVKTGIAAFTELQPRPRQSKATSATATLELETLFATLDEVLNNQIDPLTEKFRESDATFYNEYQTARSIVSNATSCTGKDATVVPVVVAKAA